MAAEHGAQHIHGARSRSEQNRNPGRMSDDVPAVSAGVTTVPVAIG